MPSPFDDDAAAKELLERLRWPDGPACPRCAAHGPDVFRIGGEKHSHRDGLHQCKPCRRQFSVTVGTVFERLRISLSTWVRAAHEFSHEGLRFGKDGQPAGTDEAGHAFQSEAGRVFRSEAGHPWRQSHGSI
jgi:transposase-like protein